ncbi:DNA-3-methyladenine glycosylase [Rhodococcus sp. HNM0569]|uniref:DNA-3-methyladenine glycosylase n=1 Tax=Rhodococcus sp. HNM0569 TaxID=2716340 RepID=UPI00146C8FF0|nr:DNA-3-methyladenine glycosylase [Rhodococcus sp. HNM0569]
MDEHGEGTRNPDDAARRALAESDPVGAAHLVIGGVLTVGDVRLRIVEVEAYGGDGAGPWPDPAAHSFPGRTARNSVMFGPAGHLYVYRSYGLHFCANVSCAPDGTAAAVLLRAGEVLAGHDVVARRRAGRNEVQWARGPGNFGAAAALTTADSGLDLLDASAPVHLELGPGVPTECGPRVGVSKAADRPWRLWIPGTRAVSAYKRSPRAPIVGADHG